MSLENYLNEKRALVDQELNKLTNRDNISGIWSAIRYSIKAGGKRIRPILTLAVADLFKTDPKIVLPSACAIEMIHTQSLIHDDLPALDNDDLRRGKPSNHKVFGEAMAIVAGDALFALAFEVIASETPKEVNPKYILDTISIIGNATGADGMCGGQALDLDFERNQKDLTKEILEYIHNNKTGALLQASVQVGAVLSGASQENVEALNKYAFGMGLAFQIVDDILDVTSSTEELGKTAQKDVNKATYPRLYGVEEAKKKADNCLKEAIKALETFGEDAKYLKELANYIVNRSN